MTEEKKNDKPYAETGELSKICPGCNTRFPIKEKACPNCGLRNFAKAVKGHIHTP
jgi:rRNA maturation endonuclease Nob1